MRRLTGCLLSAALFAAPSVALADQGPVPDNPVTARVTGTRTFDIGPGWPDTFESVPWGTLTAGDVVNVHHRPQPYVAKIGLRAQGTAAAPVVLNGVTDAAGTRPVVSFTGARTAARSREVFTNTPAYGESLGGIVIKRGPADAYFGPKPSHIQIRNLELRDARGSYTTLANKRARYLSAGCIYVHVGADILIENVIAANCAFGIFTMAKDDLLSQAVERITVRNSRIEGNGEPGSWFEHNLYIQADSPIIEGNFIGRVIAGSEGSSFKDRSARLIFRRNYVLSSARAIDLVHSEEQREGIGALPYYGNDYVYGNTIVNDSAGEAIHYGGDNLGEQEEGDEEFVPELPYRAHLFFWNNNVIHRVEGWRNSGFGLSLKSTVADVWGNRFHFGPEAVTHYWVEYAGDLRLGDNQITGEVQESGRDGSNPAMYRITNGNPVPDDDFLRTLLP